MLRVFKPTSPLSVGSFILAPFSALAGRGRGLAPHRPAAAAGPARRCSVRRCFGPPLATYTAALVANTAVPAWHEAHRELPFVFARLGRDGGRRAGHGVHARRPRRARRAGWPSPGPAVEIAAAELLLRAARAWSASPTSRAGRTADETRAHDDRDRGRCHPAPGRRSRLVSALAGATCVGASVLTRFGVFEAGLASARDPKYIVVPQRERLRAAARGACRLSRGDRDLTRSV